MYEDILARENENIVNFSFGTFSTNDTTAIDYCNLYEVLDKNICNSCKNTDCNCCRNAISNYYIINLNEENIFNNLNQFDVFQKNIIAKVNYRFESDLKYNIYFLFIIQSYDCIDNSIMEAIENDMKYARKMFLTPSDMLLYFRNDFKFNYDLEDDVQQYSNLLEQWLNILKENNLLGMLEGEIESVKQKVKENRKPRFLVKKEPNKNSNKVSEMNYITHLNLNNFRELNFNSSQSIGLKKINVLWGENGYGKSSVLEAIELAITGNLHKAEVATDETINVTFDNDQKIASKDSEEKRDLLYKSWYSSNNMIDSEANSIVHFNEKFCTYHYLDYDVLQKYISDYRNKDFSEEYILSIINIPSALRINQYIKSEKKNLKEIIEKYEMHIKNSKISKYKAFLGLKENLLIKRIKTSINNCNDLNKICSLANLYLLWVDEINKISKFSKKYIDDMENIKGVLQKKYDVLEKLPSLAQNGMEEIQSNIEKINNIFKRIYSYSECKEVICENDELYIETNKGNRQTIKELNKSQLVSLAISIIIALRLNLTNAPKFIMFDEIVANFDSRRNLNFLDMIRRMAMNDWQVFFTTADKNVAGVCRRKFSCFGEQLNFMQLEKCEENKSNIVFKKYDYDARVD